MSVLIDEATAIAGRCDWRLNEVLSGELDDLIADLERIKARVNDLGFDHVEGLNDPAARAAKLASDARLLSERAAEAAKLAEYSAKALMRRAGSVTDPETGQRWVWHVPQYRSGGGQILTPEQAEDARRKENSWRGR